MAPGDELTYDLLPAAIRVDSDATEKVFRKFDFESLAEQLVQVGLTSAEDESDDLHSKIVDRVEREVISQVLSKCDGVQIKAAQRLGINRNTLHKKIKHYGLDSQNGSSNGNGH